MQQDHHIKKYTLTMDKSDVSYGRRDVLTERMISSGAISISTGCNTCTHTTGEQHAASQSPTSTEFRCHSGEVEQTQPSHVDLGAMDKFCRRHLEGDDHVPTGCMGISRFDLGTNTLSTNKTNDTLIFQNYKSFL